MYSPEQIKFWNKIKRWNLQNIEICLANNANSSALLTMLAFIDFLGGFYGGLIRKKVVHENEKKSIEWLVRAGGQRKKTKEYYKIDEINYEKSGPRDQFLNFVKNYMNVFHKTRFKKNGKSRIAADILYDHFRCGFVHEGFSKTGTGIIREHNNVVWIINDPSCPIILNIYALRDLLRKSVFEYEKDVFEKKLKERTVRWKDRYKYIMEFKF